MRIYSWLGTRAARPLFLSQFRWQTRTMGTSTASNGSSPVPSAIDKSQFRQILSVVAARVAKPKIQSFLKTHQDYLLNLTRRPNVVKDTKQEDCVDSKLVLLSQASKDTDLSGLPSEVSAKIKSEAQDIVQHSVVIDYTHLTAYQVLRQLLPPELEIPSAYETIGHIAHFNLRECHLPYKHLIGRVILDKAPHLRTVVNKTGNIESKYRTFQMEVIAGEDDLETEVHESDVTFRFNFAEVYWNSRLQHEHNRIISVVDSKEVVCTYAQRGEAEIYRHEVVPGDMMCGIGPFAVPLAKKGCTVYANDLNPRSYHYLTENVKRNKVVDSVHCFNMDAREFVRQIVADGVKFNHVVMNLPATAIEFLDVFPGLFDSRWSELPRVHCYCFSSAEDRKADVLERAEKAMGITLDPSIVDIHLVRSVSPQKDMFCLSFTLPKETLSENVACQRGTKRASVPAEDTTNEKKAKAD